jgi:hypothetical protein
MKTEKSEKGDKRMNGKNIFYIFPYLPLPSFTFIYKIIQK